MSSKLREWLEKAKNKGYSNYEIKSLLIEKGYSEQAIKYILSDFESSSSNLNIRDNRINKRLIVKIAGVILGVVILIYLFSLISNDMEKDNFRIDAERVENEIESQVIIETVVNGNIDVNLPELRDGKTSPSNKTLSKPFKIRFVSNGIFANNYEVLTPSSTIPDENTVKLRVLDSFNILKQVNQEYKNKYAILNSVSKDIFVIWKENDLIISKGDLMKTQFVDNKGISLIAVENPHKEYAIFYKNKYQDGRIKLDIFFKNKTDDYNIERYGFSLRINELEFLGKAPIKIKGLTNGAVAVEEEKIRGIFFVTDDETYFINSEILEQIAVSES